MKNKMLESLFRSPPSGPAELERILDTGDPARPAAEMVELVRRGFFESADYALFIAVLSRLQDHLDGEAMLDVVLDEGCDMNSRRFAFVAAGLLGIDSIEARLAHLPDAERQELSILHFVAIMQNIQQDLGLASDLVELLLTFQEEDRFGMLPILRHARKEAGTPAVMAYGAALSEPALADCHPAMMEAIVEEGGEAAAEFLEGLLRSHKSGADEHLVRRALMRLRTTSIEPNAPPRRAKGRAYLGTCDGQGAFIVFARLGAGKGKKTTANLVIRAAGEIRDAMVFPGQTEKSFLDLLDMADKKSESHFIEIPLAEASRIALNALERTKRMGVKLTVEIAASTRLITSADPAPDPEIKPSPLRGEKFLACLERFAGDDAFLTWFLDEGDLDSIGGLPQPFEPERDALSLLEAVGRSPLRDRLVGMTAHMSDYYNLNKEYESSQIMAAAAQEMENDFDKSAMGRVVVARTLAAALDRNSLSGESSLGVGDPQLRSWIRERLMGNVRNPKSRHMIWLDLTEAALVSIETAVLVLPGERRPRDDVHVDMAFAVAKAFAQIMLDPLDSRTGDRLYRMTRAVAKAGGIDEDESTAVLGGLVDDILAFRDDICNACPVACWLRPHASMDEHFYSDSHPAEEVLSKAGLDSLDDDEEDYWDDDWEGEDPAFAFSTVKRDGLKVGRNDPCPCGSGKKYKKCCLGKT